MYVAAKLHKTRLHNAVRAWMMSSTKYVSEAARNCEAHLVANYSVRYKMPNRMENPFATVYDPETDIYP